MRGPELRKTHYIRRISKALGLLVYREVTRDKCNVIALHHSLRFAASRSMESTKALVSENLTTCKKLGLVRISTIIEKEALPRWLWS